MPVHDFICTLRDTDNVAPIIHGIMQVLKRSGKGNKYMKYGDCRLIIPGETDLGALIGECLPEHSG